MTQTIYPVVIATDSGAALAAARRAKSALCLMVFFVLGTELTLFFLLRYMPSLQPITAGPPSATEPKWERPTFQYLIGLMDYAGLLLPLVLSPIVLVMVLVQVAGRVAGAGRTTSAFGWSVLLAFLLFPWQAVLNNPAITTDAAASAIGMKVPGVVFTWAEVSHPAAGARFLEVNAPVPANASAMDVKTIAVLHWLRYAGFPLLAMIVVGIVHTKTERGVRQAFGTDAGEPAGEPGVTIP
jgi:hypothetical protein